MDNTDNRIMGVNIDFLGILNDDSNELFVDSPAQVVKFINDKFEEVKKNYSHITINTREHVALTAFEIAKELLTIKGNEAGILDTNTKKIKELIKIVDDALQVPE